MREGANEPQRRELGPQRCEHGQQRRELGPQRWQLGQQRCEAGVQRRGDDGVPQELEDGEERGGEEAGKQAWGAAEDSRGGLVVNCEAARMVGVREESLRVPDLVSVGTGILPGNAKLRLHAGAPPVDIYAVMGPPGPPAAPRPHPPLSPLCHHRTLHSSWYLVSRTLYNTEWMPYPCHPTGSINTFLIGISWRFLEYF